MSGVNELFLARDLWFMCRSELFCVSRLCLMSLTVGICEYKIVNHNVFLPSA
jgi:hypothetical protein